MSAPTSAYDTYTSPLATRNASPEMLRLWSARHKFNTWRKIWLAVAEAQCEMGLGSGGCAGASPGTEGAARTGVPGLAPAPLISKEQVEEMRAVVNRPGGITDEEIRAAERYERELRHDVMAHVHALGDSCPKAKGIIHLGMTSQDVVCNADLIIIEQSFRLIDLKVRRVVLSLGQFGETWLLAPTLGFTHFQAAQPTTMGRRAVGWASELQLAFAPCWARDKQSPLLRGFRGATGTQASFMALFQGNGRKVDEFEARAISKLMLDVGFEDCSFEDLMAGMRKMAEDEEGDEADSNDVGGHAMAMARERWANYSERDYVEYHTMGLTGQTYPRVFDTWVLSINSSVASVLHKIATDIRLLCNRKELDEPFEEKQIGSTRDAVQAEPDAVRADLRLARFVMNLVGNAYDTAATQWLERTLDDSSNRRLSLPEAFLALDGALDLMHNVASGLVVHEATVRKNLMAELPFMATENILMACVKLGADRQHYHELIRVHAQEAGMRVKQEGLENDLLDRLKNDPAFHAPALKGELDWTGLMDPMKYVGRSVEQTERFVREVVEPLREQYGEKIAKLGGSGPRV